MATPLEVLTASLAQSGIPTEGTAPAGPPAIGNALPPAPPPNVPAAGSETVPAFAPQQAAPPQPQPPTPLGTPPPPTPDELLAAAAAQAAGIQTPQPPPKDPLEQLREELATFRLNQAAGVGQINREVQTLKELLAKRDSPETRFDATSDPQVKFHSDQAAAIDKDVAENNTRMSQLAQQGEPLLQQVSEHRGAASYARAVGDTEGEQKALSRVAEAQRQYDALYNQFSTLASDNKRLLREKTSVEFQRQQAAAAAESRHTESVVDTEERTRYLAEMGNQDRAAFDAAIVEQAQRYGLKDQAAFRQLIVNEFTAFLAGNPNAPRVDLPQFVKMRSDALATTLGLSPKADFTQHSRQAAAAAVQVMQQPPAQPQPQAQGTSAYNTIDQLPTSEQARIYRDHARRVLMGNRGQ